jgi:hypothetical protein
VIEISRTDLPNLPVVSGDGVETSVPTRYEIADSYVEDLIPVIMKGRRTDIGGPSTLETPTVPLSPTEEEARAYREQVWGHLIFALSRRGPNSPDTLALLDALLSPYVHLSIDEPE